MTRPGARAGKSDLKFARGIKTLRDGFSVALER
jgi:hypothetical protein